MTDTIKVEEIDEIALKHFDKRFGGLNEEEAGVVIEILNDNCQEREDANNKELRRYYENN